ncbi:MAG: CDP-diacylglycerol--glycerol-3-phosphate 3-phosphatidyltransferase [Actinomycetota bacterium]
MNTPERRAAAFLQGITYLRILLVPVVMALVVAGDRVRYAYVIAAVLFAAAAFTDFLDGRLARRWEQVSDLGSFLDTTADKLLVAGVLVALVSVDRASVWIASLIIGREILILGLRGAIAADGSVMKPSIWGKLKAAIQFAAITFAIVRTSTTLGPLYPDQWAMLVAALFTIGSAVDYVARFAGVFTGERRRS